MVASISAHTLKVTLDGIKPPIWRRFRMPSDVTLGDLHNIIQYGMGWGDSHLHQFEIGDEQYGSADPELDMDVIDEWKTGLADVAPVGSKFRYTYDFGDNWEHVIVVEEVAASDDPGPVCLTAKRACPPDDCGGPWGYSDLLAVLADPGHEDHGERVEWIGGDFDPEAVDLEEINRVLSKRR